MEIPVYKQTTARALRRLDKQLEQAASYQQWGELARQYDELSGMAKGFVAKLVGSACRSILSYREYPLLDKT